ncbi:hemolysin family protein [Albidovulum sp.]
MGDSMEGSSSAQDASDTTHSSGQGGFLSRIFNALTPGDGENDETAGRRQASPRERADLRLPGIGNLRRMRVEDVAIPKAEIVAVPVTASLAEVVDAFRESGFSRLPVFKGTLDAPLGLVHLKDLALQQAFTTPTPRFNLRKLIRPLLYAPPSMPIGVLLQKMQAERIHMALVIDEYGGVDGLVTLEDLIETVIGEIEDEHDTSENGLWQQEKPGVYLAQARAPLAEFEAEIGIRLAGEEESEDVDTLGGLVFMLLGRVPARGEVIQHESGAEFEVVDADPRRIKRLRVRLPQAKA